MLLSFGHYLKKKKKVYFYVCVFISFLPLSVAYRMLLGSTLNKFNGRTIRYLCYVSFTMPFEITFGKYLNCPLGFVIFGSFFTNNLFIYIEKQKNKLAIMVNHNFEWLFSYHKFHPVSSVLTKIVVMR